MLPLKKHFKEWQKAVFLSALHYSTDRDTYSGVGTTGEYRREILQYTPRQMHFAKQADNAATVTRSW